MASAKLKSFLNPCFCWKPFVGYFTVLEEVGLAAGSCCLYGCTLGAYCTRGGRLGPDGSVGSPRAMSAAAAFPLLGSPWIFSKISKQ